MDMKQKLADYHEEISRWEKVTYRTDSSDGLKKNKIRGKRSVLFVDTSILRRMLDPLGTAATRIAYLLMDESDFGTNLYHATYEEIGEELNLSRGSVITGMRELLEVDFMRKVRNGRWMLNPAVGAKCYAEDVEKLRDMYSMQHPYTPKNKKGVIGNEPD